MYVVLLISSRLLILGLKSLVALLSLVVPLTPAPGHHGVYSVLARGPCVSRLPPVQVSRRHTRHNQQVCPLLLRVKLCALSYGVAM